MAREETAARRDKMLLAVLVLVFALPVLGSWYLVFYTDVMRDRAGTLQHGALIEPPRLLENAVLFDPSQNTQTFLHGKWTLVAFAGDDCDAGCRDNLYRMRQIRLAVGKKMFRVQRVIVLDEATLMGPGAAVLNDYPGQLILRSDRAGDWFLASFVLNGNGPGHALFLVDPNGYLMMHYPPETDPSGIIRDLERLLKF